MPGCNNLNLSKKAQIRTGDEQLLVLYTLSLHRFYTGSIANVCQTNVSQTGRLCGGGGADWGLRIGNVFYDSYDKSGNNVAGQKVSRLYNSYNQCACVGPHMWARSGPWLQVLKTVMRLKTLSARDRHLRVSRGKNEKRMRKKIIVSQSTDGLSGVSTTQNGQVDAQIFSAACENRALVARDTSPRQTT